MTINVGRVGMASIESIIVDERVRKEMGDLDSLELNMKESGLISPLAVKDNEDMTYTLLAGGRRLTVLKRNGVETVPVRIYEQDISELQMKIIEKSENFFRKDLEWQEMDRITAEIHRLQQQLHGIKAPGPNQAGWGTRDTAEMIGAKSPASITDAIRRHDALEAFPELFEGCKTASDASKVLKKIDEAMVKQVIAQKLESERSCGTLAQLSKCFIIEDFFKGVKQIPKESMHLVEIDPPYAIDIKNVKKSEGESQYVKEDYNEIDKLDYDNFLNKLFKECYRVMTQHSWLICWFAPDPWIYAVYSHLLDAGFSTTLMCGIWTKGSGQTMQPQTRLANTYEMFFYAWKGQPALNKAGHGNDFRFSPVPPNQKTHPTERPIELMKEIYDTFAFPGSRVLIPFLGSGNGLIAAHELGMSPVGFELSKGYRDSFLVKVHSMK